MLVWACGGLAPAGNTYYQSCYHEAGRAERHGGMNVAHAASGLSTHMIGVKNMAMRK